MNAAVRFVDRNTLYHSLLVIVIPWVCFLTRPDVSLAGEQAAGPALPSSPQSGIQRNRVILGDKLGPLIFEREGLTTPVIIPSEIASTFIRGMRKVEQAKPGEKTAAAPFVRTRGPELEQVYRAASPSVVLIVIAGGQAHGSGFLISRDGWLITNHHVAEHARLSDGLTREVIVHLGRLNKDGLMEPLQQRFAAEVYKWDSKRDLALLKLKGMPADTPLPFLNLSEANAKPGEDVASLGHAGLSLMWALKPGVVQAVGKYVLDSAAVFRTWDTKVSSATASSLGLGYEDVKKAVESRLQTYGNVLLVQATCPILPGDSGGPLLNLKGEVIGVNAFCSYDEAGGRANYFVHATELKEFMRERPGEPMTYLPSLWDAEADACAVYDLDGDGKPETMMIYKTTPGDPRPKMTLVGIGLDLSERSDLSNYVVTLGDQILKTDAPGIYQARAMRLQEYIVNTGDALISAYDLNEDGHFETVFLDRDMDGKNAIELRSAGPGKPYQRQVSAASSTILLDSSRIPEQWRERYKKVLKAFAGGS
jgi:S1-C subfamily serine protease